MPNIKFYKKVFFLSVFFLFLVAGAQIAKAANVSDLVTFYVDKNFDATARSQVTATLIKTTNRLYFYVEKSWWDAQLLTKQNEVLASLDRLSFEFDNRIYPVLTSVFGFEWWPGVDNDSRITVLFEAMNNSESGYFRTTDEYVKLQLPESNEREMLYLSLERIDDPKLKIYLAHEFVHLITFNQKNREFLPGYCPFCFLGFCRFFFLLYFSG